MFDFDIVPIRGKSNQIADGLSRRKSRSTGLIEYPKELLSKVMQKTSFMGAMSILLLGSKLTKTLISEYQTDPLYNELLRHPKEPFEAKNSSLFSGSRLCVPDGPTRIKLLHDYQLTTCRGNLGETKTLNRLLPLYYVEIWRKRRRLCQELSCMSTNQGTQP